jgi:catechol 2,3-dioxygenase-like lactoylglutathione lyase family enzyme
LDTIIQSGDTMARGGEAAKGSSRATSGSGGAPVLLHASLAVADLDAAMRFLVDSLDFGVELRAEDLTDEVARLTGRAGLTVRLAILARPDDRCRLELIEFRDAAIVPHAAAGPVPLAHVAFAVADLEAGMSRLTAAGAAPLGEVVAFPEGRCVYLRAPGGLVVELEELDAAPAPAG